jgi:hypothetical protein
LYRHHYQSKVVLHKIKHHQEHGCRPNKRSRTWNKINTVPQCLIEGEII